VGVPGVGVDGRDHAVRGDPLRDAPGPGPAGTVGHPLDVLAGDQAQQSDRIRGRTLQPRLLGAECGEHRVGIADQPINQLRPGIGVIPGDLRFACAGVVMSGGGRDSFD